MEITLNSRLFVQIINLQNDVSDLKIFEDCDILGFRLSSDNINFDTLKKYTNKNLLFIGTGDDNIDKKLIPEIAENIGIKGCILGNINNKTYKEILLL